MKLFKLVPDLKKYKFFVFHDDEQAARALQMEGQHLQDAWQPMRLKVFVEPRKKDTRREDFTVSCYDEGVIVVEQKIAQDVAAYTHSVELLAVETDRTEQFLLLNFTRVIDALGAIVSQGIGAIIDLEDQGKIIFDNVATTDHIFRDKTLPHLIYFSEEFVNKFDEDFKGGRFVVAGATR